MIFIDAHVHIYDCFDLEIFFTAALENLKTAAAVVSERNQHQSAFVLLLAEGKGNSWYQKMFARILAERAVISVKGAWTFYPTEELLSLVAQKNDSKKEKLFVVAGRQLVTAENIEVLALFCNKDVSEKMSLMDTVASIKECNGVPVIPWGAGKWFGKRGKVLQDFVARGGQKNVFLGDNGGRPHFWPTPELLHFAEAKGFHILSGSDPLPLPHEAQRAGSFGFFLDHLLDDSSSPAHSLRDLLLGGQQVIYPFGRLQKNVPFLLNQLLLRLPVLREKTGRL